MKKSFFAILPCIIAIMMFCIFPLTVSAEETSAEATKAVETETPAVDESVTETLSPEPVTTLPEAPEDPNDAYHTLFSRIWEFFTANSAETLSVIGSAILLILNLILKHANSKSSGEAKEALKSIQAKVDKTNGDQDSVVEVVNVMIEGYNRLSEKYDDMKKAYEQYGAMEGERNRIVGSVFATNSAILEILTTVYANSKNLPQGVKDLVNLKYANCLKTLEDDEQLRAIAEAVRNNLGTITESTGTNAEDTEV